MLHHKSGADKPFGTGQWSLTFSYVMFCLYESNLHQVIKHARLFLAKLVVYVPIIWHFHTTVTITVTSYS